MGLFCGGCRFVGGAVLVVVMPHFFYILFVISDFVWSRLRKKIGDLVFYFYFFYFYYCCGLVAGGGGGGGGGCGCG